MKNRGKKYFWGVGASFLAVRNREESLEENTDLEKNIEYLANGYLTNL